MGEPRDPALTALLDLLRDHYEAGLLIDLFQVGLGDDNDPLADALESWSDAGYPGIDAQGGW